MGNAANLFGITHLYLSGTNGDISASGGVAKLSSSVVPQQYSGSSVPTSPKIWSNYSLTNISGTAAFYPTSNNTVSGTPLFTNIYSVLASAISGTSVGNKVPLTSIKEINFSNAEIVVNVVTGTASIFGADELLLVGSNVGVYCTIFGN